MSSIKQLAIRGALWTLVSYGASYGLRFLSNITLTRLLAPELFGLMVLMGTFISALHLFSDLGIGASIIRSDRAEEPEFYNTAWTIQVLRSAGIWICCLLLTWPIAQFYREPQLLWLFPIVSFTVVIEGFDSTSLHILNRQMAIKKVVMFELVVQAIGIVVMVTWALVNRTIWALVAGGLVSSIVRLVWSHQLNTGKPNRFTWNKDALHEFVSFGRWILLSTALNFLANQSDRLILGRLLSLEVLGVYGVAYTFADLPKSLIMSIGGKVLFPTYAKLAGLPRPEFRAKIERGRIPLLLVSITAISFLVSFGDILISVLYDDRYAAAGWMLPILAIGIWPIVLMVTIDTALLVMGMPHYISYGNMWSTAFLFGGMIIGYRFFGEVGAIAAVPISNIPLYLCVVYGLWKENLVCIKQDLYATLLLLSSITTFVAARTLAGYPFHLFGA
jgi:O-antigen/teichoic acid export membrane protein